MATVSLKLLVDRKYNRVVYAESGKDFVDILFSFLTLPIGAIIRLLNKHSSVGCIDNLYESVENLDASYLETKACKTMLLLPRSAAERLCEDLLINVNDSNPRRVYRCPSHECFTKTHRAFTSIVGALCPCGKVMDKNFLWRSNKEVDVFLKGERKYIISDDLNVEPSTMSNALSLLQKLGTFVDDIEKLNVDLHRDEVLILLKRLLLSTMPLTDVFLRKMDLHNHNVELEISPEAKAQIKLEVDEHETVQGKEITMKLIQNKFSKKIVCAEMGENSMDVLLSFLTFPLGTIVKLLNKNSSIGCVDNLYKSVEAMAGVCMKSEDVKNMLLSPKLFSYFNCNNQILPIEEKVSQTGRAHGCEACWNNQIPLHDKMCKHNINVVTTTEINPKLRDSGTESGGGFAKRSTMFMVSDQMVVRPHSTIFGFDMIKELNEPISSLVEKEVTLGQNEVLDLLKASLISRNALNHMFNRNKRAKLKWI